MLLITMLAISLGIHEAAHAWVALKCGDTTGRDLGRITLNPVPHIDPVMTIVVPLMLYLSHPAYMFGGAKPVPVNFYNLRHPHRDMALVALAGPLSNFLLAAFFFFCSHLLVDNLGVWRAGDFGSGILQGAIRFNLLLAAFNLFPIPPLDGSRVMAWLLPPGVREPYVRLESMGLILVLLAIWFVPWVRELITEAMELMYVAIVQAVTLGGVW